MSNEMFYSTSTETEEDIIEKARIRDLSRNDLVAEYVQALDISEMHDILFEHVYAEDKEFPDKEMQDKLIDWTV